MIISEETKDAYDKYTAQVRDQKKLQKDNFLCAHPEVTILIDEIGKIWASALTGKKSIETSEEEEKNIKELLSLKLNSFGTSFEELQNDYFCDKCNDTGYYDGKMCSCLSDFAIKNAYSEKRIGEILLDENFDKFNMDLFSTEDNQNVISAFAGKFKSVRDAMNYNKQVSEKFIANIVKGNYTSLLISGGVGTGKTFLSHAIAKELIDLGFSVIMNTAYNIIETLTEVSLGKTPKDILNNLLDCDLLIIDDLGCERQTDYSQMLLFNLINERILRRKAIIINTNITSSELKSMYDERIISRLYGEFGGIRTFGDDLRKKKK